MPLIRLCILAAAAALSSALAAQDYYYGTVEDVFPLGLERAADGTGVLWVGDVRRGIALYSDVGGVGTAEARWRALDTALVLVGSFDGEAFEGVLRDGGGRERAVLAAAYTSTRHPLDLPLTPTAAPNKPKDYINLLRERVRLGRRDTTRTPVSEAAFPATFLTDCGTDKWVSAWTDAARDYRLTVARLPGQRLRGSLYLVASETTLLVDGEEVGGGLALALKRLDGEVVGQLRATADDRVRAWGRLSAKLTLGDAERDLTMALAERLPMACRQQGGQLDLLLPMDSPEQSATGTGLRLNLPTVAPQTLPDLLDAEWRRLAAAGERGSVWFEPLRLDRDVLSGYVHVQTSARRETTALNLDRASGRLIHARHFTSGPRKDRAAAAEERRRRAAAAHALADDADFRSWLATAALDHVTLLNEGLAYATVRHPVYGSVQWVRPWSELPDGMPGYR